MINIIQYNAGKELQHAYPIIFLRIQTQILHLLSLRQQTK